MIEHQIYNSEGKPNPQEAHELFDKMTQGEWNGSISVRNHEGLKTFRAEGQAIETLYGPLPAEIAMTEEGWVEFRHNKKLKQLLKACQELELLGEGNEGKVYVPNIEGADNLVVKHSFPVSYDRQGHRVFFTPQTDQLKLLNHLKQQQYFQDHNFMINVPLVATTYSSISRRLPPHLEWFSCEELVQDLYYNEGQDQQLIKHAQKQKIDEQQVRTFETILNEDLAKGPQDRFFKYFSETMRQFKKELVREFSSIKGDPNEFKEKLGFGSDIANASPFEITSNISLDFEKLLTLYQTYAESQLQAVDFFRGGNFQQQIEETLILMEAGFGGLVERSSITSNPHTSNE